MGKQRRKREKYHYSSKEENDMEVQPSEPSESQEVSDFKVTVPDDLFKNIKIDIDDVNKNLTEDDSKSTRSVKSISKSIKSFKRSLDVHLKKNEKRTLRRNLFLNKLKLSYNENGKQKKKGKSSLLSISEMDKHLPSVDMVFHKPSSQPKLEKQENEVAIKKPKGIMKAKDRKKANLNNLNEFKKILNDQKYKSNPLDVLTSRIEEKVFNEEL
ncbi:hypothetical protein O3M35_002872 [Rhynocoris fuscipes]|uniref:Uncharacterized protein n=1 Tax=Rhynocoris fuscipes TaxID=488301 RepID=A0AAW1CNG4_9HEMI